MPFIDRIKSKPLVISITLIIIGIITLCDYYSGSELSFSVFYLIPIALLAISNTCSKRQIIIISFFAAACWYFVDINTKIYSHQFYAFWNAHVRLAIFISIGLLVFYFRQKHDQLNETNAKLKHLNDEKNKFIGIAAHDIRNPVSGIYSFADLILSDKDSKMTDDEKESVSLIQSLSENILELIVQLLDVSKIESGHIALNFDRHDYIVFVKKQIRINQLLAKKKDISIQFSTELDELIADIDTHHLSEVLNNLLSNAIKYSDKNSVIIVKVSEEKGLIFTEVIDTGKGIPLDEQNKLFNYFQRTSTKPTDGESSTGLGLAIVKKIVLAFNGSIGVKSVVNEGSNFYFKFPVKNS
ncbi:MAG: sensor histidine kinase [Aquaticitalea sp.]